MKKITAALVFFAALAPVGLAAPNADACMEAVMLQEAPQARPTPVQEIATAERSLERENGQAAAAAVLRAFPNIRTATAGQNPLETRALRVLAMALVRTDGRATAAGGWQPGANMQWAVQTLREIDTSRPNDPSVQADLGEALAKIPTGKDEALTLLGTLAQKDLMGSPHAYAALAKLRAERGDTAGSEQAAHRCEEMSKTPGMCRPSASPAIARPRVEPAAKA